MLAVEHMTKKLGGFGRVNVVHHPESRHIQGLEVFIHQSFS
jgi:hypothetical protein